MANYWGEVETSLEPKKLSAFWPCFYHPPPHLKNNVCLSSLFLLLRGGCHSVNKGLLGCQDLISELELVAGMLAGVYVATTKILKAVDA